MNRTYVIRLITCALMSLILLAITFSCATGNHLRTAKVSESDISGVFTVMFFGSTYMNDPKTVAVFDLEGDQYTFEPYARDDEFVIERGMPAREAVKKAQLFVGQHSFYFDSYIRNISDENGRVIGYELRPLYHSRAYGRSDILSVHYRIKADKVNVFVDIKRHIKKMIFDRDAD